MTPAQTPTLLLAEVRRLIDAARQRVASTVNAELTQLYWQIGSRVHVELLQGQRAQYGKQIVANLAQQLTVEFGKGWSERQLRYCLRVGRGLSGFSNSAHTVFRIKLVTPAAAHSA